MSSPTRSAAATKRSRVNRGDSRTQWNSPDWMHALVLDHVVLAGMGLLAKRWEVKNEGERVLIFHLPFFCQRQWGGRSRTFRGKACAVKEFGERFAPVLSRLGAEVHAPGDRDVAAGDPSGTPALHKKGGPRTQAERGCVELDEISRSNGTEPLSCGDHT